MGQAPKGETYNREGIGLPLIAGAGDFQGGILQPKQFTSRPTRTCEKGDIVLGIRASIGMKVWADGRYCLGRGVASLRPKRSLNRRYLWHWLGTAERELQQRARGATFKQVSREDIASLELVVPAEAEQHRIADVLDRADELRAKRRDVMEKLESLKQSIFLDMFGDPIVNPRAWPVAPLIEATAGGIGVKAGPFGSSLRKSDYTSTGYRVYGQEQVLAGTFDIGDYFISPSKFESLRSCAVQEGDVLVSLVGSFGRVLVVPSGIQPGIINPRLIKISPSRELLTPEFLAALLESLPTQRELQRLSHGGTMGILNAGLLKGLRIPLPPLTLQHAYEHRINEVERLAERVHTAYMGMQSLSESLLERAFSEAL